MAVTAIFKKQFSEIKGVQKEEKILYSLSDTFINGENMYGIEVSSLCGQEETAELIYNISSSKEVVMNMLKYLYENAIKTETCKDVVSDIHNLFT